MKIPPSDRPILKSECAEARPVLLALTCFVLGAGASAFLFYQTHSRNSAPPSAGYEAPLSHGTESLLKQLDSPVEIHFYSLLDPSSVSDSTKEFASRVNQLLAEYEREAGGKVKVTRFVSQTNLTADASKATADGLRPFNLDKGDACFLGVTVIRNGQKETLAQLSPDFEPALESDLTRAIANTSHSANAAPPPPTDPTIVDSVKRAVPNLDSVSLEQGTQILRDAALNEFKAAVADMDTQVKAAQQALTQARNGGSEADQQSALQHLQEVQSAETQKIQQLAARSQAQIDALKQLKGQTH